MQTLSGAVENDKDGRLVTQSEDSFMSLICISKGVLHQRIWDGLQVIMSLSKCATSLSSRLDDVACG